jgi:hypothetical protein
MPSLGAARQQRGPEVTSAFRQGVRTTGFAEASQGRSSDQSHNQWDLLAQARARETILCALVRRRLG